jgi:hypothetical protein
VVGGHLKRTLGYALAGVALGGLGIGWHGQPSDEVIVAAIRARAAEHARATITVIGVARDWPHEIFGTATSRFLVTALVTPPDGPGVERCFGVEPGLAGTALALGPYAGWRCAYPF